MNACSVILGKLVYRRLIIYEDVCRAAAQNFPKYFTLHNHESTVRASSSHTCDVIHVISGISVFLQSASGVYLLFLTITRDSSRIGG